MAAVERCVDVESNESEKLNWDGTRREPEEKASQKGAA